jgi:hypothetical protein
MADVIDDGSGNGAHDPEDGPRLTKNAAVIRCDNIHSGGDGVSLAQFKYWTVLEQAMCSHRHWILPNWRKRFDSDEWLPWEAIWEWKNFSRGLTKHWGIAAVPPRRMDPQYALANAQFSCTPLNGPMPPARTQVSYDSFDQVGRSHYADANTMAFMYLRPAPSIQRAITQVRAGWGGSNARFTCLHLRTEKDWVDYFKDSPARQTVEQIVQRFNASWLLAHGHTNTLPTLTRPNDQTDVHARIFAPQRLFIAGEHTKDEFDEIIKLFLPMFPLGVFSKATIGMLPHLFVRFFIVVYSRFVYLVYHVVCDRF